MFTAWGKEKQAIGLLKDLLHGDRLGYPAFRMDSLFIEKPPIRHYTHWWTAGGLNPYNRV